MITSDDPTYGASVSLIQQATGAPASTARRWKARPGTIPPTAARLIRFAVFGQMDDLLGQDWAGFTFAHGQLFPPFFRGGFTPVQICAMFFELQELNHLRRENKHLAKLAASEKAKQWATAKVRSLVE